MQTTDYDMTPITPEQPKKQSSDPHAPGYVPPAVVNNPTPSPLVYVTPPQKIIDAVKANGIASILTPSPTPITPEQPKKQSSDPHAPGYVPAAKAVSIYGNTTTPGWLENFTTDPADDFIIDRAVLDHDRNVAIEFHRGSGPNTEFGITSLWDIQRNGDNADPTLMKRDFDIIVAYGTQHPEQQFGYVAPDPIDMDRALIVDHKPVMVIPNIGGDPFDVSRAYLSGIPNGTPVRFENTNNVEIVWNGGLLSTGRQPTYFTGWGGGMGPSVPTYIGGWANGETEGPIDTYGGPIMVGPDMYVARKTAAPSAQAAVAPSAAILPSTASTMNMTSWLTQKNSNGIPNSLAPSPLYTSPSAASDRNDIADRPGGMGMNMLGAQGFALGALSATGLISRGNSTAPTPYKDEIRAGAVDDGLWTNQNSIWWGGQKAGVDPVSMNAYRDIETTQEAFAHYGTDQKSTAAINAYAASNPGIVGSILTDQGPLGGVARWGFGQVLNIVNTVPAIVMSVEATIQNPGGFMKELNPQGSPGYRPLDAKYDAGGSLVAPGSMGEVSGPNVATSALLGILSWGSAKIMPDLSIGAPRITPGGTVISGETPVVAQTTMDLRTKLITNILPAESRETFIGTIENAQLIDKAADVYGYRTEVQSGFYKSLIGPGRDLTSAESFGTVKGSIGQDWLAERAATGTPSADDTLFGSTANVGQVGANSRPNVLFDAEEATRTTGGIPPYKTMRPNKDADYMMAWKGQGSQLPEDAAIEGAAYYNDRGVAAKAEGNLIKSPEGNKLFDIHIQNEIDERVTPSPFRTPTKNDVLWIHDRPDTAISDVGGYANRETFGFGNIRTSSAVYSDTIEESLSKTTFGRSILDKMGVNPDIVAENTVKHYGDYIYKYKTFATGLEDTVGKNAISDKINMNVDNSLMGGQFVGGEWKTNAEVFDAWKNKYGDAPINTYAPIRSGTGFSSAASKSATSVGSRSLLPFVLGGRSIGGGLSAGISSESSEGTSMFSGVDSPADIIPSSFIGGSDDGSGSSAGSDSGSDNSGIGNGGSGTSDIGDSSKSSFSFGDSSYSFSPSPYGGDSYSSISSISSSSMGSYPNSSRARGSISGFPSMMPGGSSDSMFAPTGKYGRAFEHEILNPFVGMLPSKRKAKKKTSRKKK